MLQLSTLILLWLNQLLLLPIAAPHVFPDGFVDRAIAVVVRDQTVRIEYSIGMNDYTMRQLINGWKTSEHNESNPDSVSQNGSLSTRTTPAPDSPAKKASMGSHSDSLTTKESSDPVEEDDDFSNDQQLATDFRKIAVAHLTKNLIVSCNGKRLTLSPTSAPPQLRRHMSLTIEYELDLPSNVTPIQLSISDENMGELDGSVRLALKATGQSVLTKSNVSPILVRAERIELGNLAPAARQQAKTISAQIVQVPIE